MAIHSTETWPSPLWSWAPCRGERAGSSHCACRKDMLLPTTGLPPGPALPRCWARFSPSLTEHKRSELTASSCTLQLPVASPLCPPCKPCTKAHSRTGRAQRQARPPGRRAERQPVCKLPTMPMSGSWVSHFPRAFSGRHQTQRHLQDNERGHARGLCRRKRENVAKLR